MSIIFKVSVVRRFALSASVIFICGSAQAQDVAQSCSWSDVDVSNFPKLDTDLYERQELKGDLGSTEGSKIVIFRENDSIKLIQLVLYGETGRIQTQYYPAGDDARGEYFVEIVESRYFLPIYMGASKVASETIDRFFMCIGQRPNYPNSIELQEKYSQAEGLLEEVLDRLGKTVN